MHRLLIIIRWHCVESDSFLYDVKYIVVNGRESKIEPVHINAVNEDFAKAKRDVKGRCRYLHFFELSTFAFLPTKNYFYEYM